MNETGATVADSSWHTLSGTINDGVTLAAPGAIPGDLAIALNGGGARARVPGAAALDFTTAMTAEAWVKTTATSGWQRLIGKSNDVDFLDWDLWLTDAGQLLSYVWSADGTNYGYVTGQRALNDGAWHHVVLTWDGAVIKLYSDGALDGGAAWREAICSPGRCPCGRPQHCASAAVRRRGIRRSDRSTTWPSTATRSPRRKSPRTMRTRALQRALLDRVRSRTRSIPIRRR